MNLHIEKLRKSVNKILDNNRSMAKHIKKLPSVNGSILLIEFWDALSPADQKDLQFKSIQQLRKIQYNKKLDKEIIVKIVEDNKTISLKTSIRNLFSKFK